MKITLLLKTFAKKLPDIGCICTATEHWYFNVNIYKYWLMLMDKNNVSRMAKSFVLVHALKPNMCTHNLIQKCYQSYRNGMLEAKKTLFLNFLNLSFSTCCRENLPEESVSSGDCTSLWRAWVRSSTSWNTQQSVHCL